MAFIAPQTTPSPCDINTEFQIFDHDSFQETADLLRDDIGIAVEEFLQDASAYIADIHNGIQSQTREQVVRSSHTLKSNSKSFGFTAVAQISEMINDIMRHDGSDANFKTAMILSDSLQKAFYIAEQKLKDTIGLKAAP